MKDDFFLIEMHWASIESSMWGSRMGTCISVFKAHFSTLHHKLVTALVSHEPSHHADNCHVKCLTHSIHHPSLTGHSSNYQFIKLLMIKWKACRPPDTNSCTQYVVHYLLVNSLQEGQLSLQLFQVFLQPDPRWGCSIHILGHWTTCGLKGSCSNWQCENTFNCSLPDGQSQCHPLPFSGPPQPHRIWSSACPTGPTWPPWLPKTYPCILGEKECQCHHNRISSGHNEPQCCSHEMWPLSPSRLSFALQLCWDPSAETHTAAWGPMARCGGS